MTKRCGVALAVIERQYGRLLYALMALACVVMFAMMLMICIDVFLRNVRLIPGVPGLIWSNEISENMLFLVTLLPAPWLLRQGGHIRIDIVLQAIPKHVAWYCEWVADVLALISCIAIVAYSTEAAIQSYEAGSMTIKTLVVPEWWWLVPQPVIFALVGVEVLFRMHRLYVGTRGPRDDAVSSA